MRLKPFADIRLEQMQVWPWPRPREREFFIDNLLVRIYYIIVMIMWTGLTPWEASSHLPFLPALLLFRV